MTPASGRPLYTPELLGLAVKLADYPLDRDALFQGQARSRTCGSTISAGFSLDRHNRIATLGMAVSACAVGQAAAAIFAEGAAGKTADDLQATLQALASWLVGEQPCPPMDLDAAWPGIEALQPALPHAGRHGAILLPWRAGVDALCKPAQAG
ncbi:iron-sulfur cluster assembly scaffold protein [Altererythrobacter confluentis]|uniref:Iron-sulfur cluster assembly scaffold protein n=1 Tax=Allopontixanthobacter confluentis TaxID=1849021 RepID=A0A6L7GEP7_9SPHN|nr:iron-sulfur cluster assembly scaffold protein [Allopontixanthobacter confluentis]MXP14090.1 iron-sulfur cluster assembly scaffold protein [Allopontixanthobacter confluentis]